VHGAIEPGVSPKPQNFFSTLKCSVGEVFKYASKKSGCLSHYTLSNGFAFIDVYLRVLTHPKHSTGGAAAAPPLAYALFI
jgi:hypothetical protein